MMGPHDGAVEADMLIVAALGGNALLQRGQPMTAAIQRSNARTAAAALAQIAQAGHKLVVTHGNGPQVGLLALQQAAYRAGDPYPLDILDAGTEGMIGYLIEQELENALGHRTPVATLLTQVEVDPRDPAFRNPVKFIGPLYGEAEARAVAGQQGWAVARDGDGWRRVVASPEPVNIPDLGVLRLLLDHGVIVICTGGGGIPVAKRRDGALVGVEAVIDKDRASAFLATELGADALLMLTDVDAVYRGWGGPDAEPIRRMAPGEAAALDLPEGSMGPKVESACRFVLAGGAMAGIGALADTVAILRREAGTVICAGPSEEGPL
jgi:carbamate kinase